MIENSQVQIDCNFSSQSSDDSQEALSSDDTIIHFQGKAIWMGQSKSDPIVAVENEGQKDEELTNLLTFLNQIRHSGVLDSDSKGLIVIADDQFVNLQSIQLALQDLGVDTNK